MEILSKHSSCYKFEIVISSILGEDILKECLLVGSVQPISLNLMLLQLFVDARQITSNLA